MSKLIINLLNFNNEKLAGVGYFFKRIISNVDFNEKRWENYSAIVILSNYNVNPIDLFGINECPKIKVIKVPFVGNFLIRILYEQLLLPILLIRSRGVFYSPTPAVPLLSRFFNRKILILPTIHDMIPFRVRNKYSFLRGIYIRFLSRMSARVGNRIITVSEYSRKDISDLADIKITKIDVVYNFIPETEFSSNSPTLKYFITVCTIEPGKNIENMIRGFHKFILGDDLYADYKYKIVGQFGWNYHSILSIVRLLNLEDKVEFTGYLSDSEKNNLIKNSCGMIYLSKYEGFGIPPLEAMYFNKISIVSNMSSLPEVVGEAGIIQDPENVDLLAENLKVMVHSPETYTNSIIRQLKKFDAKEQIERFENVILSLNKEEK